MPATTAVITASGLGFAWPDGTPVLDGLDLLVGPGRSGLVGVNGAGKSTLLRLVAGDLRPPPATSRVAGEVGYLPQDLTLDVDQPVDDFLGIGEVRRAVRAVEGGAVDQHLFDVIGDDWDVEDRAVAELGRLGLPGRRCSTVGSASCPAARSPSSAWPGCCCADPTCCSSTSPPTTSTPTPAPASTTSSTAGPARCSSSATTASCSSGWTGSATCATARSGGTAAATRRTPPRSRPSRRPPSRR